ncbi:MAG: hypothetical protein AMK75_07035, partial [Planctomycetes bacterium SM23_65]
MVRSSCVVWVFLWGALALAAAAASAEPSKPAATGDAAGEGADGEKKATVEAKAIATGNSEVAKLLRQWYTEGSAAGNVGDF